MKKKVIFETVARNNKTNCILSLSNVTTYSQYDENALVAAANQNESQNEKKRKKRYTKVNSY